MWVIDRFNENTGGTRLLPGSHREPLDLLLNQHSERLAQAIQPEMKQGKALVSIIRSFTALRITIRTPDVWAFKSHTTPVAAARRSARASLELEGDFINLC